jgi:hypothetical protein
MSLEDTMPRPTWDAVLDKLCVCVVRSLTLRFGPSASQPNAQKRIDSKVVSVSTVRWDQSVPEQILLLMSRGRRCARRIRRMFMCVIRYFHVDGYLSRIILFTCLLDASTTQESTIIREFSAGGY